MIQKSCDDFRNGRRILFGKGGRKNEVDSSVFIIGLIKENNV